MSWYISAIFYSFMHASFSLINQKFKIPGAVLAIWRGFGVFVVLLPFAFFISPPTSILFYVFVCINGILSGLYDNKLFEMSAKFGGGKFLRLRPLSLITLIILWWIISPESFFYIWNNQPIFWGIIGTLALVLFAILTRVSISGTSTKTPTTVTKAAPELSPNTEIATATASSKKLLAPINPARAAIS